jgi:hypothetical protein
MAMSGPSKNGRAPRADGSPALDVDDTWFRTLDQHGDDAERRPRTSGREVTRYKAYGHASAAEPGRCRASSEANGQPSSEPRHRRTGVVVVA